LDWTLALSQSRESRDENDETADTKAVNSNQTANRQSVARNSKFLELEAQAEFRDVDRAVNIRDSE
jgi:hypothetical protein